MKQMVSRLAARIINFITGAIVLLVSSASATQIAFEQHEVVIGSAKHQTVLTGFLLDGPVAELAAVHIDNNGDRHVRIYAFSDSTWVLRLNTTLRPDVLFVDIANIWGHDRLLTYTPGQLNWFDPTSAKEHKLISVTSNFISPRRSEIAHVDITHDVNGDDRDDLVVPDSSGFQVFVQINDGKFTDPLKISLAPRRRIDEAFGYRYNPWHHSGIHQMDYNRDGREDLVFWNRNHFVVHQQNSQGLFNSKNRTFTTKVAFKSDDLTSLVAPYGVKRRRTDHQPSGDLTGRVLHSLADHNGDGIADLAVFSLMGGSLWRMHSAYEIHFGTPTSDGIAFSPDVGAMIHSDGIPFGIEQHDFDHSGQIDMMYTVINPGIFKAAGMIISALLTRSVSVDLHFYRMENDIYPSKPNLRRKAKTTSLGESGKRTHWPSVLVGDVNGDRYSDLLAQKGKKELHVFPGVPGPNLFAWHPQKVKVAMPDEHYTWLADLNRDNKQDVILHHSANPHRVIMLIAR